MKETSSQRVHRSHVIRLDPTIEQRVAFARAAGVARFTYNWALAEWNRQHEAGEKPTACALKKQFNAVKRVEFPWIVESPRDANSQPFADLGRAFGNYFASLQGKRKGKRIARPQFKRKGVHDSFYVANDRFSVWRVGRRGVVRLPVIGEVRMMEALRFEGKILSGRVFRRADHWYIAIAVELQISRIETEGRRPVVGVDLGLKTAVVLSSGEAIDAPKPLCSVLRRLRRASRRLHRREKGGANRRKAQHRFARIHERVSNIRRAFWQKITTRICRENQAIVVEDLSQEFMRKNRKLSRVASDVALGMFRSMLEYKALTYGSEIVVADRLFPSTQRCSWCGEIRIGAEKLALGDRTYRCAACGLTIDRDANASRNLEEYPRLAGNGERSRTPMETSPLPNEVTRRASGSQKWELGR